LRLIATETFEFFSCKSSFATNLQVQHFSDFAKRRLKEILAESELDLPDNSNNILPIVKRTSRVSPYFTTSGKISIVVTNITLLYKEFIKQNFKQKTMLKSHKFLLAMFPNRILFMTHRSR
jgi:hypothetical protein